MFAFVMAVKMQIAEISSKPNFTRISSDSFKILSILSSGVGSVGRFPVLGYSSILTSAHSYIYAGSLSMLIRNSFKPASLCTSACKR